MGPQSTSQEFKYFWENSKLKQLVLEWPGVDMVLVQQRWISPGRSLLTETINMVQCYALPAGQLEPNQGLTFLMRSSPRTTSIPSQPKLRMSSHNYSVIKLSLCQSRAGGCVTTQSCTAPDLVSMNS